MLFSFPTRTIVLSNIKRRDVNIFFIISIFLFFILLFYILFLVFSYFLKNINIFSQFDLTTSTDNEDFLNLSADVLEISVKNKTFLLDFIFLPSMSFFTLLTAYEFYKLFR